MPQYFFFSSIDAITSAFDIKSSSSLAINQNIQGKFIQYAIMDAIPNQIETENQERVLSLDLESKSYTERSVSYGLSNKIINQHKRANPWLTRDMLNNYKRSKREGNTAGMPSIINPKSSVESNTSNLTDPAAPSERSHALNDSPEAPNPHKKGGRPKGSTAANKATLT
jgi:hypothetical protein